MSEEINVNNFIAVGNGEKCPYCIGDCVFVASEDNDITQHMMDEHPSVLNKLFSSPPSKPWLEDDFQLLMAKIGANMRIISEENLPSHERIDDFLHAMYADLKEFFIESE